MVVLGVGILLAGCAGGADSDDQTAQVDPPVSTSLVASTVAGLPDVTFDACEVIEDSVFRQFGLDPTRKTREETSVGEKDLVACRILQPDRSISFFAQNVPWEEIPLSAPAQSMTINGRETLYVPDSLTEDSCALLMRTSFGAVIIDTFPRRGGTNGFTGHACDGVVEMAEAIEPLITD
nr:DUF3558 family protein [Millisia brevis]